MRRNPCCTRALSLALLSLSLLCIAIATPARAGTIRISEVLVNPDGTDNGKTFVELVGPPGTPLAGYVLVGIDGGTGTSYLSADLSAFSIPSDGIFVVADAAGGITSVAGADALFESLDPQNGPDTLQLRLGAMVIDAIGYGDFSSATFAGEGNPAPLPPSGQSLARVFADVDTENNASDFVLAAPTPGTAPFSGASPVPEPCSLFLVGMGLAALTLPRRRAPSLRRPLRLPRPAHARACG